MQLYKTWKERQISAQAFSDFQSDIAIYNLHTLRQISWVGVVGGLLLVVACLPPLHLLSMLHGYLALTALFAVLAVLTGTALPRRPALVLPVYYAFVVLFLAVSIAMGTVWGKDSNAITFVMLVVVLPLLIIDRPVRMHLIFGVMCVAFCVIDYRVKDRAISGLDIANCVAFYLLSVVLSRQAIRTKMSDIIVKHELKRQRDMDMLTKLSNRSAFERHVEQYLHESNEGAAMLIMDLDNFKSVNDQMGHEYGDMVLKRVGDYMRSAFRRGDLVSRLGGDEFVAFLPAVGALDVITDKAGALIRRIGQIQQELSLTCAVGASIGVALYPNDGCSFEELYRRADAALYRAKHAGKGTVVIYQSADEKPALP